MTAEEQAQELIKLQNRVRGLERSLAEALDYLYWLVESSEDRAILRQHKDDVRSTYFENAPAA